MHVILAKVKSVAFITAPAKHVLFSVVLVKSTGPLLEGARLAF